MNDFCVCSLWHVFVFVQVTCECMLLEGKMISVILHGFGCPLFMSVYKTVITVKENFFFLAHFYM